jgi:TetR/AcrR family transcriptional repressor of nem operon
MNRGRPKSFNDNDALERAMRVFWRSGYDATSLDDLLRVMEIPRQSLYRTFGDKRTLFLKALKFYGNRLSETISHILQIDGPATDKVDALFKLWSEGVTSPEGNGCMMQNTCGQSVMREKEVVTLLMEHQQLMTDALEKVLDQGKLEGNINNSVDTRAVTRTVISSINGLFGLSRIGLPAEFSDDVLKTLRSLIQPS